MNLRNEDKGINFYKRAHAARTRKHTNKHTH